MKERIRMDKKKKLPKQEQVLINWIEDTYNPDDCLDGRTWGNELRTGELKDVA